MTTNLDTCRLNLRSVKFRLYVCVTIKRGVALKYVKAGVVQIERIHTAHVGFIPTLSNVDPYGENLVKATLPGGGWTYHHDGVNLQLHRIFRQSGMTSDMEVEDYFLRKLRDYGRRQFIQLRLCLS
jgi:hypothetical protein